MYMTRYKSPYQRKVSLIQRAAAFLCGVLRSPR